MKTVKAIQSKARGFVPTVGIILGSGLGSFVKAIDNHIAISYDDLVGFPKTEVDGHKGNLILGFINNIPVAVLQGRAHYYESGQADVMKIPIQTLAELGCKQLLLTNAAGSLNLQAQPGSVMLIKDHINFTGVSPLFGEKGMNRFVDMVDAYNTEIRNRFKQIAKKQNIKLHEGTYIWFCGPSFETPAEIKAAKMLGADAVGMSTVPEVILARYYGMKVAAHSVITNMAAGLSKTKLSHEQTILVAKTGVQNLQKLLLAYLKKLPE